MSRYKFCREPSIINRAKSAIIGTIGGTIGGGGALFIAVCRAAGHTAGEFNIDLTNSVG